MEQIRLEALALLCAQVRVEGGRRAGQDSPSLTEGDRPPGLQSEVFSKHKGTKERGGRKTGPLLSKNLRS